MKASGPGDSPPGAEVQRAQRKRSKRMWSATHSQTAPGPPPIVCVLSSRWPKKEGTMMMTKSLWVPATSVGFIPILALQGIVAVKIASARPGVVVISGDTVTPRRIANLPRCPGIRLMAGIIPVWRSRSRMGRMEKSRWHTGGMLEDSLGSMNQWGRVKLEMPGVYLIIFWLAVCS